jgi:hypothetical protein
MAPSALSLEYCSPNSYTVSLVELFARGAMVARQVLTLKIEVRVLAGEPPVLVM